jgi:hypothetical protein
VFAFLKNIYAFQTDNTFFENLLQINYFWKSAYSFFFLSLEIWCKNYLCKYIANAPAQAKYHASVGSITYTNTFQKSEIIFFLI